MNEFNKFLTKYNKQLITIQAILILGAVNNQNRLEQEIKSCEFKAGIVKVIPQLPKFTALKRIV